MYLETFADLSNFLEREKNGTKRVAVVNAADNHSLKSILYLKHKQYVEPIFNWQCP